MVNNKSEQLDLIFQALSDATRRRILLQIAAKECTVGELAEPYRMTLAAVSKHLKVLEKAGLLRRTVDGRVHRCNLDAKPLAKAVDVIQEYQAFWGRQLDALDEFLKSAQETEKNKKET